MLDASSSQADDRILENPLEPLIGAALWARAAISGPGERQRGFKLPSSVGINSVTVGWMWTARWIVV